jgi:hypothetical protein
VSKIFFGDRGFAPIRRGLRGHLGRMSSNAVKLYLWLHLVVSWTGKKRGTVETTYSEIAKELKWPIIRVKRTMAELRRRYVKVKARGNQHKSTLIRILKYTKKVKRAGIAGDTGKSAGVTGETSNDTSTDTSTLRIAAKTQEIRTPKKAVEGSRSKAAANEIAPVWRFLGIQPCGNPAFRELLEGFWISRNGDTLSKVIGTCLDAWRDASGENGPGWKKGLQPLFHALAALRAYEKGKPARSTAGAHASSDTLSDASKQAYEQIGVEVTS